MSSCRKQADELDILCFFFKSVFTKTEVFYLSLVQNYVCTYEKNTRKVIRSTC